MHDIDCIYIYLHSNICISETVLQSEKRGNYIKVSYVYVMKMFLIYKQKNEMYGKKYYANPQ